MYQQIYNHTNESFKQLFDASLKVYPCSYNPTSDLTELPGRKEGTVRCHLPLEAKALRFFMYCQENGKCGKILTSDYRMETFTTPQTPLLGFVTVDAKVYIDDMLVGSATAGQSCDISNFSELDNVIQYTSGLAKSRALSNAGFGIVGGTDVDASLAALPIGANQPTVIVTDPSSNPAVPTGNMSAGFQNYGLQNSSGYVPAPSVNGPSAPAPTGDPSQVNLFQQLGGQVDPLTQAKTMPYPLNGQYKGQSLGSLNTRTLQFLANKATNDPALEAAVQAARLVLADREKASGKAR